MKHKVSKLVWDCLKATPRGIPYVVPGSGPAVRKYVRELDVIWEPRNPNIPLGTLRIRFDGPVPEAVLVAFREREFSVQVSSSDEVKVVFGHTQGERFTRTAAKAARDVFDVLDISYEHVPSAPSYTWIETEKGWKELGAHTWTSILAEKGIFLQ